MRSLRLFILLLGWLFVAFMSLLPGRAYLAAHGALDAAVLPPVVITPLVSALPTPVLRLTPAPFDTLVRAQNVRPLPAALAPQLPVTIRDAVVKRGEFFIASDLYIDFKATGKNIRLGDDNGSVYVWSTYPGQVLWQYYCEPCGSLKPGSYIFDIEAGTNTLILPEEMKAIFPKTDGNWIIFPLSREGNSPRYPLILPLIAHDMEGQREIALTDHLYFPISNPGTYAVGSGIAVWAEWGAPGPVTLMMHDFATGITSPVPLKADAGGVGSLTVHDGVIVWINDEGAQGFDLATGSHFRIPYAAPGWNYGDVLNIDPVRADGNRLIWGIQSFDKVWHYYTADLVRSAAAATPIP